VLVKTTAQKKKRLTTAISERNGKKGVVGQKYSLITMRCIE
jgi:hypothetical protein